MKEKQTTGKTKKTPEPTKNPETSVPSGKVKLRKRGVKQAHKFRGSATRARYETDGKTVIVDERDARTMIASGLWVTDGS